MSEAGQETAADGDARARNAGQKRERLASADKRRGAKADALGLREALLLDGARLGRQGGAPLRPPPELLETEHEHTVDDEKSGGNVRAGEERLDSALEEDSKDGGRDRA